MVTCQDITLQAQKESCGGTAHLECVPVQDAAGDPVFETVNRRVCAEDVEQLDRIISGLSSKTVLNVTRLGEPERSTSLWDEIQSLFW